MYQRQPKPDESVELMNGSICTPVATLKDEYGGVSHIVIDDHCYVLVNDRTIVKHWFTEAVTALQLLPANPRTLEPVVCCAGVSLGDQPPAPLARKDKPST